MKLWLKKQFNLWITVLLVFLGVGQGTVCAEQFYMEPIVQNTYIDDVVPVWYQNQTYYVSLDALAQILKIKRDTPSSLSGSFIGEPFSIMPDQLTSESYLNKDGRAYFSLPFYEKLFNLQIKADPF